MIQFSVEPTCIFWICEAGKRQEHVGSYLLNGFTFDAGKMEVFNQAFIFCS